MKIRKITFAALLTAAALGMFLIEAQLPALTPVPGVKPGLSNIVTLFCLYTLGGRWALRILLCRILLGSLLTGQVSALAYSLSGGLAALALSCLLRRFIPPAQLWVISAFSAMAHGLGQLCCTVLITGTPALFAYLPVLLLSGILSGAFTGAAARAVLVRLEGRFVF